jgi:ribosomal protein L44E
MLSKARANPVYNQIGSRSRYYYRNVYLESDHWKNLRREKLEKTPFCEKCNKDYCLDVHHLEYRNLFGVSIKDLQTLCRICHEKEHEDKSKAKKSKKSSGYKLRRRSKRWMDYENLKRFIDDKRTNFCVIRWLLKSIIGNKKYLFNQNTDKIEKTKKYLGNFHQKRLQKNKEFDEKYGYIHKDMDNYVSVHY